MTDQDIDALLGLLKSIAETLKSIDAHIYAIECATQSKLTSTRAGGLKIQCGAFDGMEEKE